jgi:N-acetylglutamate synthase-like GNAT family acetyltransferase
VEIRIRKCGEGDIVILAETIRNSFRDVAERFGLTQENAPRHPSNCTAEWIRQEINRGTVYFVLEKESQVAGCVALEKASSDVCYLERLGVLPGRRRNGFGGALVKHVLSEAKRLGAHKVNIGIIAEHTELKNWYQKQGFVEIETKKFPHLPFEVSFLSRDLKTNLPFINPVDKHNKR